MTKPTLILFGRIPQYGVGKRRLASGVGNLRAWQFYRRNLSQTLRKLTDPRWTLKFAGTPDRPNALNQGQGCLKQGTGDLGDRLIRQINQHKGLVLIIGTDVPDLKPSDIFTALSDLKRGSAVLGRGKPPLDDGGFWCLGLRRANRSISPRIFKSVAWSSATTADATRSRLNHAGFKVIETVQHNDVDDKTGYDTWRLALGHGPL